MELATCYGLIQLVIWTSRSTQRLLFWIAFAWILATTLVYRPDASTLGLPAKLALDHGWRPPSRRSTGWIGFELHTLHPLRGAGSLGLHMAGYLLCAFEQQFILQDYFLFRMLRILPTQSAAVIAAAVRFTQAGLSVLTSQACLRRHWFETMGRIARGWKT